MRRFLLCVGVVFAAVSLAHAQDDGPNRAVLYPAALPSPALKHRLLPDLRNQTTGNAAPVYEDAIGKLKPLQREPEEQPKWREQFSKWTGTPLRELPRDEVRKALEPYKEILDLAEKAARREYCDWDLPARLRKGGFSTLLPEVQFLREIGTLLSLRARLEIADGELTKAVRTLQTGLALAKQVGEQPTFINHLVGTAIAQLMLRQLEDFVQQPKAPNLYWALTDLPQPLIDQRKSFEGERIMMAAVFPGIGEAMADPNAGPLTKEQVEACVNFLVGMRPGINLDEIQRKVRLTKYLTEHYEEHKKVLLDHGRPKDKVDAMPHVQVGIMAEMYGYEQMVDDQAKWANEPYYQVVDRLDQLDKARKQMSKGPSILPEGSFAELGPAVTPIIRARVRLQRKVDALRCLEAIRAYAAAHEGKLPGALDEIKDVPIPLDPATGKAFAYKVSGDKATLEAPAVGRDKQTAFPQVAYEITIKR
jgi:hypothetical protein